MSVRWWNSDKIVTLEITSWVGTIAFGAIHYYGKLCGGNIGGNFTRTRVEVKRKITAEEAKELNGEEKYVYYEKGDMTDRLKSPEDVRHTAKRMWKKLFPKAIILLEGSSGVVGPQVVLVAPRGVKERLNDLYDESERWGDWDKLDDTGKAAVVKIEKRWDAEMQKLVRGK